MPSINVRVGDVACDCPEPDFNSVFTTLPIGFKIGGLRNSAVDSAVEAIGFELDLGAASTDRCEAQSGVVHHSIPLVEVQP